MITKTYDTCMQEMKEALKNAKEAKPELESKLQSTEKELKSTEKEIETYSSRLEQAKIELEKCSNKNNELRSKRQKALISGKDHSKISEELKKNNESLELLEDTVIPLQAKLDELLKEKEASLIAIEDYKQEIQLKTQSIEEIEAVINYNESAEKLAPYLKKIMKIYENRGYENNVFLSINTRDSFSDIVIAHDVFNSLPKLYLRGFSTPVVRDKETGINYPPNGWHYDRTRLAN